MDHKSMEAPTLADRMIEWLERLDNAAHVVVAVLFILMAVGVLAYTGVLMARQVPLIVAAARPPSNEVSAGNLPEAGGRRPGNGNTVAPGHPSAEPSKEDPFFASSLEVLSSILFAVIILELLRTIITYLKAHDIRLIMQEFLVVGIISTVRKILLVGAHSSLSGENDMSFIHEAYGTILSILGILMLIVGLIALRRAYGTHGPGKEGSENGQTEQGDAVAEI